MCESCGVAGETPGEREILDDEEVYSSLDMDDDTDERARWVYCSSRGRVDILVDSSLRSDTFRPDESSPYIVGDPAANPTTTITTQPKYHPFARRRYTPNTHTNSSTKHTLDNRIILLVTLQCWLKSPIAFLGHGSTRKPGLMAEQSHFLRGEVGGPRIKY